MAGFTENYVKVHAPYNRDKVNTFEKVVIGWLGKFLLKTYGYAVRASEAR
jgi:hypothetical protein